MTENTAQTHNTHATATDTGGAKRGDSSDTKGSQRSQRGAGGQSSRKGGGRDQRRDERSKPEYDYTVVDIRRVTRVMAGGRRFSFRVTVVAGNRRGTVGVGTGKAMDTPMAIDKAFRDAKANMVTVQRTASNSVPCDIEAKFCGSRVLIVPSPGRGIIAGSSVRPVVELAGLTDVSTKLLSRSKNKLNNAKVAVEALKQMPPATGDDATAPAGEGSKAAEADKKES